MPLSVGVPASADHIKESRLILVIIAVGVLIAGLLIAGMGIVLVVLHASGHTSFSFFGQNFKSQNVGIAAIFLGAATIVIVLSRLMKRLKEIAALPSDS